MSGYDRLALPRTRAEIEGAARDLNLVIPYACIPGVIENLTLIEAHADTLRDAVSTNL